MDGVSENFCRTKETGIYEHPSFCNRIIYCTPPRQEVEVVTCPPGTGFNPFFLNCDWPGFLRCVDIRRGIDIYIFLKESNHGREGVGRRWGLERRTSKLTFVSSVPLLFETN